MGNKKIYLFVFMTITATAFFPFVLGDLVFSFFLYG